MRKDRYVAEITFQAQLTSILLSSYKEIIGMSRKLEWL